MEESKEAQLNDLVGDYATLIKEHKYYKAFKRLFSIIKINEVPNKKVLVKLSSLINSVIGMLYYYTNILKAMKLLLEHIKENKIIEDRCKSILNYLGLRGLQLNKLGGVINKYENVINREAYHFINLTYPTLLSYRSLR